MNETSNKPPTRRDRKPAKQNKSRNVWIKPKYIIPIALLFILLTILISSFSGFYTGNYEKEKTIRATVKAQLIDEYFLALDEIENGFYERAINRLSYIYDQDETFTMAFDKLVEVKTIMNATSTSTQIPPTPTATPTRDTQDQSELFNRAVTQIDDGEWSLAIDNLAYLRLIDPDYRSADVDGLMYVSLLARGSYRILYLGQLETGLYDFTLAEQFGPLDQHSLSYREWARYYLLGNGFWIAAPDLAAYYYGQVVNMAPNLRDSTGMTSFTRYWLSLVQHADNMATQSDWCEAKNYYNTALLAMNDDNIQPTFVYVDEQCFFLTETPAPTSTPTPTIDPLITPTETPIPTDGTPPPITETPTP